MADMEKTIRQLQDTLTVMEGIQARQAAALKEHGVWLQEHDRAVAEVRELGKRTDERLDRLTDAQIRDRAEARERERRLDERIDRLVSAIGEWIRARNGGTEE